MNLSNASLSPFNYIIITLDCPLYVGVLAMFVLHVQMHSRRLMGGLCAS